MKANFREKLVAKTAQSATKVAKWGNEACYFYFYEPKKPENINNVDMKDVKDLFSK